MNDREYQKAAVEAMISHSNTGGIILCATGAGKTYIAAQFFQRLLGGGLFVVDELTLLTQSAAEIGRVTGEKIGIVGRGMFRPERITIATVQTLHKHREDPRFRPWMKTVEVIVIDEFHIALNRRNIDVIRKIKPLTVFGLTATLELHKPEVRLPAIALAGPVIYRYPIQQGVDEGHLIQGEVCNVEFRDPILREYCGAGDYDRRIVRNRARNECIEAIVREALRRDGRVIVLVERIAHLRILSQRLRDVNHRVVSGNAGLSGKPKLRIQAMRDMDEGELPLIIANRVFGKGVNIITVNAIVDGTGMPNRNSAIQRYGRGVRRGKGKAGLLYVNISDRGNRFARAAYSRENALRETGAVMRRVVWRGKARDIWAPPRPKGKLL